MRTRGPAALLLAVALALGPSAAARKPAARRSIAVLEFRGGAGGARDVGLRIAAILRRATSLQVVDPDDARRRAGAQIDEEVARCRGQERCVAALGARLGVDEVLLVGVSEFGDLILALQRVSVARHRVIARVAESLPRGTDPDQTALEGYLKRLLPPEDFRRYGTIRVIANVDGAVVEIGGRPHGVTPIRPVRIEAPARLDVRVTKRGYEEFVARVAVPPDATVEVRPRLAPRVRQAWYGKWWVWAIAGGVAAGAAAGGVLLTRDAPSQVPVQLNW